METGFSGNHSALVNYMFFWGTIHVPTFFGLTCIKKLCIQCAEECVHSFCHPVVNSNYYTYYFLSTYIRGKAGHTFPDTLYL